MIERSNALAFIVRQTELREFANAITITQQRECNREVHTPARCEELAAINTRQQVLADVAAIGFALFAAVLVGRIAVPSWGCWAFASSITVRGCWCGPRRSACREGCSMANPFLMHNLAPFVILIAIAVLLEAWLSRPLAQTLEVRPAQLMSNIERRSRRASTLRSC